MGTVMQPFENGRTLPAKSLDFWFDYACPYAYLGSSQAPALAEATLTRHRVTVSGSPVLCSTI